MPKIILTQEDRDEHAFSKWVKGEMFDRGLTQEQVAEELGLDQTGISNRLRCKVPWRGREIWTLERLFDSKFELEL